MHACRLQKGLLLFGSLPPGTDWNGTVYQDVHVMIWVGFGFLMTFLKRYGQSATGLTFLVGAVLVQVALICNGLTDTLATGAKAYLSLERSVFSILRLLLRFSRKLGKPKRAERRVRIALSSWTRASSVGIRVANKSYI